MDYKFEQIEKIESRIKDLNEEISEVEEKRCLLYNELYKLEEIIREWSDNPIGYDQ
jgi:predicted nuclease with TOPRIM domain